ncbi:ribonuclease III [Pseudobacteroides cellulosolvens]|uniref:Ribonuclease 3 n=1 Tax=Pseudobacteroides cellulosolvens ATCC 35603 = DSM 2933 TaxID=398512 RepID=A0A0L6JJU5_9FIRM|nr:ribonuclease III [Pseudobacteroides cellulosolvens]KNY26034.1 Ribonuclease 3 [Pseudobacteroides cellulosolvens ATCC 35603 = DSM 2933]
MINLETLLENLNGFEEKINYKFKNRKNIILALTHSSYANENRNDNLTSNERLEFLGDAVLNIIISETIYSNYPNLSEGQLTKVRANIVCEQSLVKCSNNIEVGKFLLLGKGEDLSGGRTRTSILSDAFEAIIGAVYLDGGMKNVKAFVLQQMDHLIKDAVLGIIFLDYKTQFQEIVQKDGEKKIIYEILEENGPDHDKEFVAQVKIMNKVVGKGKGKSKKEAEQAAAKAALESLNLKIR